MFENCYSKAWVNSDPLSTDCYQSAIVKGQHIRETKPSKIYSKYKDKIVKLCNSERCHNQLIALDYIILIG